MLVPAAWDWSALNGIIDTSRMDPARDAGFPLNDQRPDHRDQGVDVERLRHNGSPRHVQILRTLLDQPGVGGADTHRDVLGTCIPPECLYERHSLARVRQGEQAQPERRHVVCVNGAAAVLDLLREIIQAEHYTVTTTNFVPRTFDQIAALQPDAASVDLVVGIRSGWDLLAQLHLDAPRRGMPVIVTSTDQRFLEMVEEQSERYGGNRFIVKPFDIDDLTALVRARARVAWIRLMASIDWTRDEAGRIAMEILAMTAEIAILMQEMTAIITTDPVRWRALQRELVDIMRQRAAVQQLLHRQRVPAADTRS